MIYVAGGIVYNPNRGVVVVSQRHNSWSLPKGHVELGENVLEAAVREIHEESGIPETALMFVKELISYERGRIKQHADDVPELRTITLFLFTTTHGELSPIDQENPEARWIPIDEVSTLLTHPKDKEIFELVKNEIHL